jgi:hypothetical protein
MVLNEYHGIAISLNSRRRHFRADCRKSVCVLRYSCLFGGEHLRRVSRRDYRKKSLFPDKPFALQSVASRLRRQLAIGSGDGRSQDCLKKFDAAAATRRDEALLCSRCARSHFCLFSVYRLGPCRRAIQEDRSVADLDHRRGRVADQRCFAIEIPSFLLENRVMLLRTNTLAQLNHGVCPSAGPTRLSGVLRLNRRILAATQSGDRNAHFPTTDQVIGWARAAQWTPTLVSRGHLRSRTLQ